MLVGVVCAGVSYVVEDLLFVQAEALGDRNQTLWAECALTVDIHGHAFATALRNWQLASDAQRMTDLGLAGAELAEDFRDGARLNATAQQLVEGLAAGRQMDHALALLEVG